jgi:DNA-binding MarR family transcriptional regulator
MGRGLSDLQRKILAIIDYHGGHVAMWVILKELGLPVDEKKDAFSGNEEIINRPQNCGGQRFNKTDLGKSYNAVYASVSRALTRLENRGMIERRYYEYHQGVSVKRV